MHTSIDYVMCVCVFKWMSHFHPEAKQSLSNFKEPVP